MVGLVSLGPPYPAGTALAPFQKSTKEDPMEVEWKMGKTAVLVNYRCGVEESLRH
jgi:hypothetical protein